MPWYKSGTASVTLNSNAVIGTGTAFIVNCRVGDAFRGPDGAWYEVTNVASNTALSISPTYKGATTAAGSYALAPMQGYVKDSADALRAIVNTYGAQLAALGTTGNYDVLPVSKGGTGGASQSTAQAGLGIVRVNDTSDTTAGRFLTPGWMGLGNEGTQASLSTFLAHVPTGSYRCVGNTTAGSPVTSGVGGMVLAQRYSTTDTCYRVIFPGTGQSFEGYYNGSTLTWTDVYTTSSVERGNNANGTYAKYPDGSLECWWQTGFITHGASGEVLTSWILPSAPILSTNSVALISVNNSNSTQTYTEEKLVATVASASTITVRSRLSAAQGYSFNLYFKGRWK